MSLEGAFEINDHKAAFHSPLNPPPRCSKRQLCLEALNTFPLAHVPRFLPLLQNATEKNQPWVMFGMPKVASQPGGDEFETRHQVGGGGEARHRGSQARRGQREGSRRAGKMRRRRVGMRWDALTSANAPPDIPVYGSQTHESERGRWVCHQQEGEPRSLG